MKDKKEKGKQKTEGHDEKCCIPVEVVIEDKTLRKTISRAGEARNGTSATTACNPSNSVKVPGTSCYNWAIVIFDTAVSAFHFGLSF